MCVYVYVYVCVYVFLAVFFKKRIDSIVSILTNNQFNIFYNHIYILLLSIRLCHINQSVLVAVHMRSIPYNIIHTQNRYCIYVYSTILMYNIYIFSANFTYDLLCQVHIHININGSLLYLPMMTMTMIYIYIYLRP